MPTFQVYDLERKKGWEVEVNRDRFFVGRSPKAEICLRHSSISRQHLLIEKSGREYRFVDLCSTNGTLVNDERYKQGVLANGDTLRLGAFRIVVHVKPVSETGAHAPSGSDHSTVGSNDSDAGSFSTGRRGRDPGLHRRPEREVPDQPAAVRSAQPNESGGTPTDARVVTPVATATFVVALVLAFGLCVLLGVLLGSLATTFDAGGKPSPASSVRAAP